MTTIIIRKNREGAYLGFCCMGHAEYGRAFLFHREPDILCAAISAWTIGTINALEELAGEQMEIDQNEETGFLKCDFRKELQERSVFLMDSMVYVLQGFSKKYGEQYLQVKFEEV